MIHIRIGSTVLTRSLLMLRLRRRRCNVMLIHRHLLLRRRPCLNSTGATIITNPVVHRRIIDHRPVDISIMHNCSIHIGHRSVVMEMAANPSATHISDTTIAKTIVHTPIETNMLTPITAMPAIITTGKTPIARRPQKSNRRRCGPIPGYPIVTLIISAPGPITRYPKPSIRRTGWLYIDRDRRRRNTHGYTDTYLRGYPCRRSYTRKGQK